jgi:hypothetical protein
MCVSFSLKYRLMKKLLAPLLLLIPLGVLAQEKAIAPFIPAGWKVIATQSGDLNKDTIEDLAVVIENTDTANFTDNPAEGFEPRQFNTNPRRLLVLFKNRAGSNYTLADSSESLIPPQHDPQMPCLQDPFLDSGEMAIDNGVLVIALQTFMSCGTYHMSNDVYRFKHQDGGFSLIGYDHYRADRVSGQMFETSINFLTKKKSTTTGGNLYEDKPSDPKTTWDTITVVNLPKLSGLEYGSEMNY